MPAPSNAGPSGLLIRLDLGDDGVFGLGRHSADYLSDGTVIRWVTGSACEIGQGCGTLERNSLTASGLAAFKALLAKTADLLGEPIVVKSQIAPDAQPSGRGETTDVFVQERPDGTATPSRCPAPRPTTREAGCRTRPSRG